jgi:DNA-binding MltR family transcriptional regulator
MPDIGDLIKDLFDKIHFQTQRTHAGVAIATAAILDNHLELALKAAMLPMSKRAYSELFDSFRPLSTFSAKIRMAYALRIVSKEVHGELEKIRKIRNVFAHSSNLLHFGSPEVAPLFATLKHPTSKASPAASIFVECARPIIDELVEYVKRMGKAPSSAES